MISRYSKIEHVHIGLNFEGGSLRDDCLNLGSYWCFFDHNEALVRCIAKELYHDDEGNYLLESATPELPTEDVSVVVKAAIPSILTTIKKLSKDRWNAISSGRLKSQLECITARVGHEITPAARVYVKDSCV